MLFAVLATASGLLLLATALPLLRHEVWWIRGLDFPRLQLFVAALVLALAQIVVLDWNPATQLSFAVVALCLCYQAWWILPYTWLWRCEVNFAENIEPELLDPALRLRLLTANVLMTNRNATTLLSTITEEQPDVFVTLESDAWWQAQLDTLSRAYPHAVKCPLDNLYGMHVYSRRPLRSVQVEFLIEDGVPSVQCELDLGSDTWVRMHFLHPAPPSPSENETSIERDAELITIARRVADSDMPIIVTGDMNDVAWSATTRLFRKISGLLDPRIGRGMFNTFHANYWFARWPLDHIFHSADFQLRELRRLPSMGSDHFPLLSELVYMPRATPTQSPPPSPSPAERSLARQKIDQIDN